MLLKFFFFSWSIEQLLLIYKYNDIYRDQGQVLKVLSGGDFFGEIGILSLSEGQNRWEQNALIAKKFGRLNMISAPKKCPIKKPWEILSVRNIYITV